MDGERIKVLLAAGSDLPETIAGAMEPWGNLGGVADDDGGEIVVAVSNNLSDVTASAEIVASRLRRHHESVRIARPAGGLFPRLRGRGIEWTVVDVSARAERLERVSIPRSLAQAGVVAVCPFDEGPLAIGVWALYVHPRLALAARLAGERTGLAAEIALAFAPRLIVLFGAIGSLPVVVAGDDLIAVELVGLALRRLRRGIGAEVVGPWEDSLVQRATELRLGVQHPDEIALVTVWAGAGADPGAAVLEGLADRVRLILGIAT